VITALRSLVDAGQLDRQILAQAIQKYGIDTTKPNPMTV
jgi:pyruvate dehydrogenase E1 component